MEVAKAGTYLPKMATGRICVAPPFGSTADMLVRNPCTKVTGLLAASSSRH